MVVGTSFFFTFYKLQLNLCLLGASGTGRTTFVNTLCDDHVLSKKVSDDPEDAHNEEGINIKPVSVGKEPKSIDKLNNPNPSTNNFL
jgi:septin family protein